MDKVTEMLSFAGIDMQCFSQVSLGGNTANWGFQYNYPPQLRFLGTVRPHILIKSVKYGLEEYFPIVVKQNLTELVTDLKSGGALGVDPSSIIHESLQQMVVCKSSELLITDFFRLVYLQLDRSKISNQKPKNNNITLYYRFKIVSNEEFPLTNCGLLTWIFVNRALKSKSEMRKEREFMLKFVDVCLRRNQSDLRRRGIRSNAELLNFLNGNDFIEVNEQDLGMSSIQEQNNQFVATIRYQNYEKVFGDHPGFQSLDDRIILNIVGPSKDPDDMDSEVDMEMSMLAILESMAKEFDTYRCIKQYNSQQNDERKIIKIPQVLRYGTISIWNDFGVLRFAGVYNAIEKINSTRKLNSKELKHVENLVSILRNELNLKLSVQNFFVHDNDEIYLVLDYQHQIYY